MKMEPKINYIYILGASHSGSTLLAMLLNAHPDIATIGETSRGGMGEVNTYRCSCGKLIKDCLFWRNITNRLQSEFSDFSLSNFGTKFEYPSSRVVNRILQFEHRGPVLEALRDTALKFSPGWRRARQEVALHCYGLASVVLAESNARIFVDSSKLAHRLKFLLHIPEFNIKVIHLIRDGRAVALTYMRQDEFADSKEPSLRRGGRGMKAEHTSNSLPMKKAADEWRRCLRSAKFILAILDKSRWIEVCYENLCRDTENTLKRIFEFLDLDPQKRLKDFRSVEHHIVGNGMRLDTTPNIQLDERWRSVLTENDLHIFNRVTGKMNRKYGYNSK
jgi:hypothetical protein